MGRYLHERPHMLVKRLFAKCHPTELSAKCHDFVQNCFWCHFGVASLKHIFWYRIEICFVKKICGDISMSRRTCWGKEFVAKSHSAELSVKCRVFVRSFEFFRCSHATGRFVVMRAERRRKRRRERREKGRRDGGD